MKTNDDDRKISRHKRHEGVYLIKSIKEDFLGTLNISPGNKVYGEKTFCCSDNHEYRAWNPFRSKLGAAVIGGINEIYIKPGSKVLYLGASSGATVSHCSDIVGAEGIIYAVEFSSSKGKNLQELSETRTNIISIIGDARKPQNYGIDIEMVDVICVDVDQPDQERILALNAKKFLKIGGGFLLFVNAASIDTTIQPHEVFSNQVNDLKNDDFQPREQLTLEPFEKDHCIIVGLYKSK